MKKLIQNLKFSLATIMALAMVFCLLFSALIPINNLTIKSDVINQIQSVCFFIFLGSFLTTRLFFKEGREKTVNFFKNLKKEKKVINKDLPDNDCGCKKKK